MSDDIITSHEFARRQGLMEAHQFLLKRAAEMNDPSAAAALRVAAEDIQRLRNKPAKER